MNILGKVYSLEYILFLIISIVSIILFLLLSIKYFKKYLNLEITILSILWLALGIANRISEVYNQIYILKNQVYTWKMLIPFSLCSTLSIIFPVILIISKGKSKSMHFFIYASLFAGLASLIYPAWIAEMPNFWNIELQFGLIHHVIMLLVTLLLIISKRFIPKTNKFYVFFLGYIFMVCYGLFLYTTIFNYTKDINIMNINKPFFDKAPNITSWWGIMLIEGMLIFIFLFIYEKLQYKTTFKEFLLKLIDIKGE